MKFVLRPPVQIMYSKVNTLVIKKEFILKNVQLIALIGNFSCVKYVCKQLSYLVTKSTHG